MAYAHTLAKIDRSAPITVGSAYAPSTHTLNFGEQVSVVLTTAQLAEAQAVIAAAIDEHMATNPPPVRAA